MSNFFAGFYEALNFTFTQSDMFLIFTVCFALGIHVMYIGLMSADRTFMWETCVSTHILNGPVVNFIENWLFWTVNSRDVHWADECRQDFYASYQWLELKARDRPRSRARRLGMRNCNRNWQKQQGKRLADLESATLISILVISNNRNQLSNSLVNAKICEIVET